MQEILKENLYDSEYVKRQMEKFRNREKNHFKNHIKLAKELIKKCNISKSGTLLDIGCSIGTFAIEFAKDGYVTYGLDYDQKSLNIANELSLENNADVKRWICADAGNFNLNFSLDAVVCFDLLEHLSDDTISNMLKCIKTHLKPEGFFVFHTFPTEFDHIFFSNNYFSLPLIPFRDFNNENFSLIVRKYSKILDYYYLLRTGRTHKQIIQKTVHPNPLSEKKLKNFFSMHGYELVFFEKSLDQVNPLKSNQGKIAKRFFSHQPIVQRSLYGIAKLKN